MTARSSAATKAEPLVVERTFDAPAALVWQALTDPDQIRRWSFDMKGFAPKVGAEFEFTGGDPKGVQYVHRCRMVEVKPEKKLAYTWRYEGYPGDSLVTFELFPEGTKTRPMTKLRLTHEGLETFPDVAAFARANFQAGWTQIVGTSLKRFVEGRAGGTADTPAALVGDREIAATRIFDAPRDLVWRVWTEPEHVAQWWGPNGFTLTTHRMEVKPGGVWRFVMHGPDGRDYPNKITYDEVAKPERLAYRHGGTGEKEDRGLEPVSFRVTVTFAEQGGKTRVDMRMVFPSEKARDHVVKTYGAVEGLNQTLGRLEQYLAGAA